MGVKSSEETLCKVAYLYVSKKIGKDFLMKAALMYAESKNKARDRRDEWKLRKRLGNEH